MVRWGLMLALAAGVLAPRAEAQTRTCRPEWPAFAALAGSWNVLFTYRLSPDRYETHDVTAVIEVDPARCLLIERLDASAATRPMSFLFVTAFAHPEAAERVYYDTEHARFLVFTGAWDGEMARFERSQQMNANRIVSRTEVRPASPDSFTAEMQLSTDGGETWNPVQRMEYRRQAVVTTPAP